MRIFIDTSAFYTLLDRDDAHHARAKSAWTELLKAVHTLVTSNYILVETFALLQNRLGIEAARAFHNDVLPLINIEFVASGTPSIWGRGASVCIKTGSQPSGLCQFRGHAHLRDQHRLCLR